MWVKRPKHSHLNDTLAEGTAVFADQTPKGWEAFDVQALFPEEFPAPEAPTADQDEGTEQERASVSKGKAIDVQQEDLDSTSDFFTVEHIDFQTS